MGLFAALGSGTILDIYGSFVPRPETIAAERGTYYGFCSERV